MGNMEELATTTVRILQYVRGAVAVRQNIKDIYEVPEIGNEK